MLNWSSLVFVSRVTATTTEITYDNNIDTNEEGAVNCNLIFTLNQGLVLLVWRIWLCCNFNVSNVQSFSKYVLDYVLYFIVSVCVCVLNKYINCGCEFRYVNVSV